MRKPTSFSVQDIDVIAYQEAIRGPEASPPKRVRFVSSIHYHSNGFLTLGQDYEVVNPDYNDPDYVIRIIDDSGEAHTYPKELFVNLEKRNEP